MAYAIQVASEVPAESREIELLSGFRVHVIDGHADVAEFGPLALKTVIELRKELGVYKPPFDPPERFFDASYWSEATGLSAR